MAWFPLGPRDVYRPSHAVSRGYFENVNRSNTVVTTTVINNYIAGNNTVVNHGIGRETVARVTTTKIREVSVRETPVQNLAGVRGDGEHG